MILDSPFDPEKYQSITPSVSGNGSKIGGHDDGYYNVYEKYDSGGIAVRTLSSNPSIQRASKQASNFDLSLMSTSPYVIAGCVARSSWQGGRWCRSRRATSATDWQRDR